jgi:hypothetical protein
MEPTDQKEQKVTLEFKVSQEFLEIVEQKERAEILVLMDLMARRA